VKIPEGDGYKVGYFDVRMAVPGDSYFFIGSGKRIMLDDEVVALPYSYNLIRDLLNLEKNEVITSKLDIPGSSVKGSIRTILELSLKDACILFKNRRAASSWRWRMVLERLGIDLESRESGPCGRCTVCKMFGYTSREKSEESEFEFSDFIGEEVRLKILELMHNRGVERLLVVMPNNSFRGRINFVAEEPEIGLLSLIMFRGGLLPLGLRRLRREGDLVFGRVRFELKDFKVLEVDRGPHFVEDDIERYERRAEEVFGDRLSRYDFVGAIEEVNRLG